jgi:hypothetical protein
VGGEFFVMSLSSLSFLKEIPKKILSRISSLPGLLRSKTAPDAEKSEEDAPKREASPEDLLFEAPGEDLFGSQEPSKEEFPEDISREEAFQGASEEGEEKPFRDEKKRGLSPRRLLRMLLLVLCLLALLLGGVLSWKILQNLFQEPSGPSLRNLSRKQENLYSPLGFPLTGDILLRELPEMGISLEREEEGRYRGVSEALEILLVSQDGRVAPLFLGIGEKQTPLKWGLRVGTSLENLLDFFGPPTERSGDLLIYRDGWNNQVLYRISEDRIARVEYHYPQGLLLEK